MRSITTNERIDALPLLSIKVDLLKSLIMDELINNFATIWKEKCLNILCCQYKFQVFKNAVVSLLF